METKNLKTIWDAFLEALGKEMPFPSDVEGCISKTIATPDGEYYFKWRAKEGLVILSPSLETGCELLKKIMKHVGEDTKFTVYYSSHGPLLISEVLTQISCYGF